MAGKPAIRLCIPVDESRRLRPSTSPVGAPDHW